MPDDWSPEAERDLQQIERALSKPKQVWTALSSTDAGRLALQTIAEHAQFRMLHEHGPAGPHDKLLNWESVSEYGGFKITVRCDYKQTN